MVGKAIIGAKRVAGVRWQKTVIQKVWSTDLKITDMNFVSILLTAKKENYEALYDAAVNHVARNLIRLKTTDAFRRLQTDPNFLIGK